jgi:hypothetical protein
MIFAVLIANLCAASAFVASGRVAPARMQMADMVQIHVLMLDFDQCQH